MICRSRPDAKVIVGGRLGIGTVLSSLSNIKSELATSSLVKYSLEILKSSSKVEHYKALKKMERRHIQELATTDPPHAQGPRTAQIRLIEFRIFETKLEISSVH